MFARKGALQGKRTSIAMRQVFGEGNNSMGLSYGLEAGSTWQVMGHVQGGCHTVKDLMYCTSH